MNFNFLKFSPKKGIVPKSLPHTRENERRTFLVSRVYCAHSGPLSVPLSSRFFLLLLLLFSPFFFFPFYTIASSRNDSVELRYKSTVFLLPFAIAQMFFRAPEGEACSLYRSLELGELTLRWYATIDLTAVGKRRGKIKGGIEVHVGSFASQLYLDNDQKESYLASRNVRWAKRTNFR